MQTAAPSHSERFRLRLIAALSVRPTHSGAKVRRCISKGDGSDVTVTMNAWQGIDVTGDLGTVRLVPTDGDWYVGVTIYSFAPNMVLLRSATVSGIYLADELLKLAAIVGA
jgi:hypothetical protein